MLHFALMLAAQFAPTPPIEGRFDGTCLYPEVVRQRAAAGELVTCNQAEIAAGRISFGLRSWETRISFNGTFEGDRMTVDTVTLANGRTVDVRGVCELFYSGEALSTVACTASGHRGAIAANFVVSRINDPF